ncbi:hypothetical protein KFK14_22265 [Sphingobium phenoxybenzoativorans]|uniref:Uncharacterized protein n=1 Tax=Sphingobium phenoxybenzoativorans TaxID=1592790 RepID=A0A975K6Z6_9SPHN|nr:hypothetical protein [Sphingobium phenoxybenzoativorans]QUT05642.1 hypothetical protein KFK14_22265 [Sphingobium phenoxybenzoativorans]
MEKVKTATETDIGWRQFATHIFDLSRWPLVVLVIGIFLRAPIGRLLDAISLALRGQG